MSRPRYAKLRRDVRAAWGRVALMVVAVAVSLTAVGAMLTARTVVLREAAANYAVTDPASATLEVEGDLPAALLDQVRAQPGVTGVATRQTVAARVRVGDAWRVMLLFVIDADDPLHIARFDVEQGSWPPPGDGILLERSALAVLGNPASLTVTAPNGARGTFTVTGVVHDAALAPASQERTGYGYLTPAGLSRLGLTATMNQLKVVIPGTQDVVDAKARELAAWLAANGHSVHDIKAPPAGRHPHQNQVDTVTLLFLGFAFAALILAAVVVSTTLGGMLAQQIRQIGVLKTLGATTRQIYGLYLLLSFAVAATATLLAIVPFVLAGRALTGMIADTLNLNITDSSAPWWVFAVLIAAGLSVPLLIAFVPLARAARTTVRAALDHRGVTSDGRRPHLTGGNRLLTFAVRNTLRRRGRLALTLVLLTAGGALFTTGLNTAGAWNAWVENGLARRSYDAELRLAQAVPVERLTALLHGVGGLSAVEPVSTLPATPVRSGQVEVLRTYPDGGHGAFNLTALPADSRLVDFELMSGRWLRPGETDAVVLNQGAATRLGGPALGEQVVFSMEGRQVPLRVAGVVAEVGGPATAYTAASPDAAATAVRLAYIRPGVLDRAEEALTAAGVHVQTIIPTRELRAAIDEHVMIFIQTLTALAVLMAVVGALGLASAMGIAVTERTREFGILQTVGATPRTVRLTIVLEGLIIGLAGSLIALAAGIPLSAWIGGFLGRLSFGLPLPLELSATGMAAWVVLGLAAAAAATFTAARRASRLTIREILAYE